MKACSWVHVSLLPMWPSRCRDIKNDSVDNRTLSCMQGLGSLWTSTVLLELVYGASSIGHCLCCIEAQIMMHREFRHYRWAQDPVDVYRIHWSSSKLPAESQTGRQSDSGVFPHGPGKGCGPLGRVGAPDG